MDEDFKKLLRALSDAVNESLMNSSAFVDAIAAMWRANRDDASQAANSLPEDEELLEMNSADQTATLTLTADDENFLRMMRIACPV